MALVQNFTTATSLPNQISLNWNQPIGFNNTTDEIIVTRTSSYYPVELFNASFPTKATDVIPVELFRGHVINGLTSTAAINILTDGSATFPTSPSLAGRLLRDSNSQVFRILSNTAHTVTLSGNPALSGPYVVLADFPSANIPQQNFQSDIRTTASSGEISNLVQTINGNSAVVVFAVDSLANTLFADSAGTRFVIKSNDATNLYFFDTATPIVGNGMALLASFVNSQPTPYIDTFSNATEAAARTGTGLQDDTFYYYTAFTNGIGLNVAQAEFSYINAAGATQSASISTKNLAFGDLLYNYWPTLFQQLDTTADLYDLMQVFGWQFNQLHSYINTFTLQDSEKVYTTALQALADQTGLPSVGYSIGADTLRRVAKNMIDAWRLKGSKDGIALFIRILTTWDVTNGTGNTSGAITDFLPNITALRFFSPSLGTTNVRLTSTNPFISGGRFAKTLPGIVIPGFFTFREFVISMPNIALFVGTSTDIITAPGATTLTDSAANFGVTDGLVGNYLYPNEAETSDYFIITANTSTTITVRGVVNDTTVGNTYIVLSPLNTNRFNILNKMMPIYIPYGTLAAYQFS